MFVHSFTALYKQKRFFVKNMSNYQWETVKRL
jgi:hypothetical protein